MGLDGHSPPQCGRELVDRLVNKRELVDPLVNTRELVDPLVNKRELVDPLVNTRELVDPLVNTRELVDPLVNTPPGGRVFKAVRSQIIRVTWGFYAHLPPGPHGLGSHARLRIIKCFK